VDPVGVAGLDERYLDNEVRMGSEYCTGGALKEVSPPPRSNAAGVLAAMSLASTRRGEVVLARAQLMEALRLVQREDSRNGISALEAAAELAAVARRFDQAVVFYGARERVLRNALITEGRKAGNDRARALEGLRQRLGPDRYEAAWAAAGVTPFPLEFYVAKALEWLEGIEASVVTHPLEGRVVDGTTSALMLASGTTAQLIAQARRGNGPAREVLAARFMEPLRRFAHGRLPPKARGMIDTNDLVQTAMIRAFTKLRSICPRQKGGFFAYLRQILMNQVRDEFRRNVNKPETTSLSESIPANSRSPLEDLLEKETLDSYRAALSKLSGRQREALALRVEYGFSYQEVSDEIGCTGANAARMVVSRALDSVAKTMRRG